MACRPHGLRKVITVTVGEWIAAGDGDEGKGQTKNQEDLQIHRQEATAAFQVRDESGLGIWAQYQGKFI